MTNKKIGIGSFSLLLGIIAVFWSSNISWLNDFCFGDKILRYINLPTWSNGTDGTHYTVFYAYLFLIPALILSQRFKNNLFSKAGKWLSLFLLILIGAVSLFMI